MRPSQDRHLLTGEAQQPRPTDGCVVLLHTAHISPTQHSFIPKVFSRNIMGASAAAASPTPHRLIVLKGYHVGSYWFAEVFNRMAGCSFHFEFEHCLRKMGRERQNGTTDASSVLAPPTLTLQYLNHACDCTHPCSGCTMSTPVPSLPPGGSTGRIPCRVTGISFGALGSAYLAHVRAVLEHDPRVAIIAHVRSNHIKHAISHLRTSCDGELNHMTTLDKQKQQQQQQQRNGPMQGLLTVPPGMLLLRAVNEAHEQERILKAASDLAGGRNVRHVIVYEALQQDVVGEMRRLLHAMGVEHDALTGATASLAGISPVGASSHTSSTASTDDGVIKAGKESLRDVLANYDEIEAFLRPLPCLHSMLAASSAAIFQPRACAKEMESLPVGISLAMRAARDGRKLKLNATECGATQPGMAANLGGAHRLQSARMSQMSTN